GKNSIGIQPLARFTHAIDGVDERIQTYTRRVAQQGMGIEQSIDHHVVVLVGCAQEGPGIAYDRANPWIEIGMLWMPYFPLHKNRGVDLNGIDFLRSIAQAGGNIVAGARADN